MPANACPRCAGSLDAEGDCAACRLDAAWAPRLRRAADALARRAARRAGEGAWQAAYDYAAESLRLAWHANDLAAFILVAATVAGARGSVGKVPRPRMERLPPILGAHATLLALAEELRGLGERLADSPDLHAAEHLVAAFEARFPAHRLTHAPCGELQVLAAPAPTAGPCPARRRAGGWLAAAAWVSALLIAAFAGVAGAARLRRGLPRVGRRARRAGGLKVAR
jgi:hypothetical protein